MTQKLNFLGPLLAAMAACCGAHAAEPVAVVQGGKAVAHIVLDSRADSLNRQVAEDFAGIVQRISGARIPQEGTTALTPIYLGEPEDFTNLPIVVPALEKEEFFLNRLSDIHF